MTATTPWPSGLYVASASWPGEWAEAAACAGLQPLHDDEVRGETAEEREARHYRAASVCRVCPVLRQCREWREATPVRQRVGVSAGRVRRSTRGETDLLAMEKVVA